MEIKGFITNLGKYNEGYLVGKWVGFPIDEDDLNDILKDIGCAYTDENGEIHNQEYEEYFFTDWDTEENLGFGEYENIDYINEIAEVVTNFTDYEDEVFLAAMEIWNDVESCMKVDNYMLFPDINSRYDLGYYYAVESGCYDFDENNPLMNYIDYDALGREIDIETSGGFTSYGWIECVA